MTDQTLPPSPEPSGEIILFQTDDGETRLEVRLLGETVWLPQRAIAELFQTTPQNLTLHFASIYEVGELVEPATCKDFLQVQVDRMGDVKGNKAGCAVFLADTATIAQ